MGWGVVPGDGTLNQGMRQIEAAHEEEETSDRAEDMGPLLCHIRGCGLYKNPEVTADMIAYMVMIVKAAEEYAGLTLIQFDGSIP